MFPPPYCKAAPQVSCYIRTRLNHMIPTARSVLSILLILVSKNRRMKSYLCDINYVLCRVATITRYIAAQVCIIMYTLHNLHSTDHITYIYTIIVPYLSAARSLPCANTFILNHLSFAQYPNNRYGMGTPHIPSLAPYSCILPYKSIKYRCWCQFLTLWGT